MSSASPAENRRSLTAQTQPTWPNILEFIATLVQVNTMGKKRKSNSRPFGQDRSEDRLEGDSKLRISTWEDVADSEDEFYINRDKILLDEGPAQKKQRRIEEEGEKIFGHRMRVGAD